VKGPGRLGWALLVSLALALGIGGSAAGAPLGQIGDFPTPTMNSQPQGIVAGPDGNLWFAETSGNKIAAVNPSSHAISEFSVPTGMSMPRGVALGPDGNIWFTEFAANKIGEINPFTHAFNQFTIPGTNPEPVSIVEGSDGNMWFTEFGTNSLAFINPTSHGFGGPFTVPTAASGPFGIAAGPDGNIWFTEQTASKIGEIKPGTTTPTDFATPTANAMPTGIAAGPDGNLWFTELAGAKGIGEMKPGTTTPVEFPTLTPNAQPTWITPGPDGNMWFTEAANPGRVAFFNPTTPTVVTEFVTPTANSAPWGIATGSDGNLWFTENGAGRIGLVGAGAPAPQVSSPVVTGAPQPGNTLTCQGATFASYAGHQPSASMFGFDGFRWLLNGNQITGANTPKLAVTAADVGHQIACRETVTYPLLGTTVIALSAPVTVSPSLGASLPTMSFTGNTAALTIACQGLPTQTCSGPVTLTSKVTTQRSVAVAVSAKSKPKGKSKPKPGRKVTKTVTVASGSYSVSAGRSTTLRLKLNASGQKLLNQFYRLPATLAVRGTTWITRSVAFSYGRLHISPGFVWVFTSGFTYAMHLTLARLPSKATTTVTCRGGGCPFTRRTFTTPKHRTLDLARALKRRHLAPGTTLTVQITAPNTVGEVVVFTMRSGAQPGERFLCLVPGSRRPAACVSR
jgi:streptogramin lyase